MKMTRTKQPMKTQKSPWNLLNEHFEIRVVVVREGRPRVGMDGDRETTSQLDENWPREATETSPQQSRDQEAKAQEPSWMKEVDHESNKSNRDPGQTDIKMIVDED